MTEDLYSAFAQRLGVTREEAKRRAYRSAYSGEAPPGGEVLGTEEIAPAGVRLPQVSEVAEDHYRMCYTIRTKAGQRFRVPFTLAQDIRRPGESLTANELLGAALQRGEAAWIEGEKAC